MWVVYVEINVQQFEPEHFNMNPLEINTIAFVNYYLVVNCVRFQIKGKPYERERIKGSYWKDSYSKPPTNSASWP